jgi:hypothetical protein
VNLENFGEKLQKKILLVSNGTKLLTLIWQKVLNGLQTRKHNKNCIDRHLNKERYDIIIF